MKKYVLSWCAIGFLVGCAAALQAAVTVSVDLGSRTGFTMYMSGNGSFDYSLINTETNEMYAWGGVWYNEYFGQQEIITPYYYNGAAGSWWQTGDGPGWSVSDLPEGSYRLDLSLIGANYASGGQAGDAYDVWASDGYHWWDSQLSWSD